MNNLDYFVDTITLLKNNNLLRTIKTPFYHKKSKIQNQNDDTFVNLISNDYLGFAFDNDLFREFIENISSNNIEKFWFSSSGSRLLSGNSFAYESLESKLSKLYNNREVLIFNSGYHANTGIIPAIIDQKDVIFFDKLCHASIIDGILLSKANYYRYNHLDYSHLELLLKKYRNKYKNSYIISESVFSMDGDIADLNNLIKLKNNYDSFLYIDEAHAVGVFGENGLGIIENLNCFNEIDFFIGTFGKAYASLGAFLVTDNILKKFLVNKCRSLIYSTALPPIILSWTEFIIDKSISYIGKEKRNYLKKLYLSFIDELKKINVSVIGNSQIVPILCYSNELCNKLSDFLKLNGFYVLPIRPPTVPNGKSRIRISLNSEISFDEINRLLKCLSEFYYENKMDK